MGAVYRATGPEGPVAVKVLFDVDPEALARFRRETLVGLRVEHPHVLPVRDAGAAGGRPYVVMDLLPGGSLAERLRREGPLPPAEAAGIGARLARALAAAHACGVVHRDVKPANVLFDAAGEPRLADFGLAGLLVADRRLTRTGDVLGTPAYMAPEQAAGQPAERLGPACDVYGLGATLYATLTGRPPFEGRGVYDVLRRVLEEEPAPPSALRPGLPPDLDAVCRRCLAKRPAERFQTAADLADALERSREIPPRRPGRGVAVGVAGAFVAAAAAAGGLAWAHARPTEPAGPAEPEVPRSSSTPGGTPAGSPDAPAGSPDAPAGSPASPPDPRGAPPVPNPTPPAGPPGWSARLEALVRSAEGASSSTARRLFAAHDRGEVARAAEELEARARRATDGEVAVARLVGAARLWERLGERVDAYAAYRAAAERDPRHAEAVLNLLRLGLSQRVLDEEAAITVATEALPRLSEDDAAKAVHFRSVARNRLHRYGRALEDASALVPSAGERPAAVVALQVGVALAGLGRSDAALPYLAAAARADRLELAALRHATELVRLGRGAEADAALERLLERGRPDDVAWARLERLHLATTRSDWGAAERALEGLLRLPEERPDALTPRGWLAVAFARAEVRPREETLDALERVRADRFVELQASCRLVDAISALDHEDYALAERRARAARERDPHLAQALYVEAKALVGRGRPEEALRAARAAADLDPWEVDARLLAAHVLCSVGRPGEAVELADHVLGLHERFAIAYALRGAALEELGEREAARAAFERALDLYAGSGRERETEFVRRRLAALAGD